jgi:glycosyltransferase involved in cell wall biosynthesis
VVAPGPVGGLERVVHGLVAGQVVAGFEAYVAVVLDADDGGDHFLMQIERTGAGIHAWRLPPRAYRRERALLAAVCRELGPDVVHTHGYRPDVVDAPVARRLGIATVTTVHGFTAGGWKNRAYQILQRRAYRRFDAVVAVSRPLASSLARRGIQQEQLRCVPNAWFGGPPPLDRAEARRALDLPPEGFRIGFVGRLDPVKGPDLFLEALALLGDLPVEASVVGSGPLRESLEERAAALGARRVRWHGLVQDMGRLVRALDVLVLSSRSEGTPIVLFEAMAAGTPVVATRVGGVPDVVGPGEALVVEPLPVEIARAVREVHAEPEAAQRRAEAARARLAECFAREPWIRRYERIYREAMSQRYASAPTSAGVEVS